MTYQENKYCRERETENHGGGYEKGGVPVTFFDKKKVINKQF